MPLDPPSVVGPQIASAVLGVGVAPGSPVTNAQLIAIWTAVYTVIYTQLTTKAGVNPGLFIVTDPDDGPLPVSGVGGPLV